MHQFGYFGDQFVQERIANAQLMAVEHGATQQSANHIALFLIAGVNGFVNRERTGSHMVGNATQASA
jgi:hypothetical protein